MRRMPRLEMLQRNPIAAALVNKPLSSKQITDLQMMAEQCLDEALHGDRNTVTFYRSGLAEVANLCYLLGVEHYNDPSIGEEAQKALLRADARHADGKNWALDGPGIEAVKDAVYAQGQMLRELGQGDVTNAILTAMAKLKAGQVHRLETA